MSEVRLIQSIERAAAILEIIAQEGGAARLQHIAGQAKLGKTTAHNLLKTLDELGYVHRRAGDTRYHLGGRILNLARIAGDDGALRSRLRPALEAVARRTGEMVYLAVPSGDEVCYLDAIEASHALKAGACPIGIREPVEGSAVGLVFLAFMPGLGKRLLASRADALGPQILSEIKTVATRGFALDLENSKPGLSLRRHSLARRRRGSCQCRAERALGALVAAGVHGHGLDDDEGGRARLSSALLNIWRFQGAIGRLYDFAHHVEAVAPPARSHASTGATSLSNVLIVHAHPEPKSLTSALKDLAVETLTAQGHAVQVSDLYAANWKAVADRGRFSRAGATGSPPLCRGVASRLRHRHSDA